MCIIYLYLGNVNVNVSPKLYQYTTINKNGTYIIPPGYNGLNTIVVNFEDTGNNTAIPVEEVLVETKPDPENPEAVIKEGTVDKEKYINNYTWNYNRVIVNYGNYWNGFNGVYSGNSGTISRLIDNGYSNNFFGVQFFNNFDETIYVNVIAGQWNGMAWFFCLSLTPNSSITITNDIFPSNESKVYMDKSKNESDMKILKNRFNPVYFEYRNEIWKTAVLYSLSPPLITVNDYEQVNLSSIDKIGVYVNP